MVRSLVQSSSSKNTLLFVRYTDYLFKAFPDIRYRCENMVSQAPKIKFRNRTGDGTLATGPGAVWRVDASWLAMGPARPGGKRPSPPTGGKRPSPPTGGKRPPPPTDSTARHREKGAKPSQRCLLLLPEYVLRKLSDLTGGAAARTRTQDCARALLPCVPLCSLSPLSPLFLILGSSPAVAGAARTQGFTNNTPVPCVPPHAAL